MIQAAPTLSPSSALKLRLQAYSSPLQINLEQCRTLFLAGTLERYSRDCLILQRSDDERIFIFSFGAAVFCNVPPSEHEYYLNKIGITAKATTPTPSADSDDFTEDHFMLQIDPGVTKVTFSGVTLPDLETTKLQLVAQVLAQSSALELIEREVDEFLAESEMMTSLFKSYAVFKGKRAKLIQFLGEGLSARHRIVNQLAILKEPDKTWEKEDLYLLYKELFANFEIEERIEKIEHMFDLSSQVTELLLEIVNARRAEIMEMIIIALIAVEIVKSFVS